MSTEELLRAANLAEVGEDEEQGKEGEVIIDKDGRMQVTMPFDLSSQLIDDED